MTDKDKVLVLRAALEDMLESLRDYPTFDLEAFETRDVAGLCKQGGDVCFVTLLAITAADALKKVNENEDTKPKK